ncbi:hypothetical protein B0H13DRAFT_813886 [Mycena leptocephala]|nr:hypothetical protein B0H13DRAFT_813886 [Mycena leptocephala]
MLSPRPRCSRPPSPRCVPTPRPPVVATPSTPSSFLLCPSSPLPPHPSALHPRGSFCGAGNGSVRRISNPPCPHVAHRAEDVDVCSHDVQPTASSPLVLALAHAPMGDLGAERMETLRLLASWPTPSFVPEVYIGAPETKGKKEWKYAPQISPKRAAPSHCLHSRHSLLVSGTWRGKDGCTRSESPPRARAAPSGVLSSLTTSLGRSGCVCRAASAISRLGYPASCTHAAQRSGAEDPPSRHRRGRRAPRVLAPALSFVPEVHTGGTCTRDRYPAQRMPLLLLPPPGLFPFVSPARCLSCPRCACTANADARW